MLELILNLYVTAAVTGYFADPIIITIIIII